MATATANGEEKDAVEAAFERYSTSALARNGRATAETVSRGTIAVYESCRKLALDARESELERLTQAEVILVLRMRYAVEREALAKMDGRAVYVHGVENGWISDTALDKIKIEKVRYDGDKAYATVTNDGEPVPGLGFDFVRERGQWRFDVQGVLQRAEPMFAQLRRQENKNKVQLAMMFLERVYGEQIPKDILAGPLE
jgi:hypothetical protein